MSRINFPSGPRQKFLDRRAFDRLPAWRRKRILDRLRQEESEKHSLPGEVMYRSLFENNLDAIFTVDCKGRFLTANPAAVALSGYSIPELQRMGFTDLCVPECLPATMASFQASLQSQQPGIETAMFTKSGERVELFVTGLRLESERGMDRIFCIARDITLQKRSEFRRNLRLEFLGLVNSCRSSLALIQQSIALFHHRSGCDAVGLRLREEGDHPYFESRGFSPGFIVKENRFCGECTLHQGCPIESSPGGLTECLCARVLQDQCQEASTDHGSFWSGDLSNFGKSLGTQGSTQLRGECLSEGFHSIALIPLGKRGDRRGLLQFSSRQKHLFSLEMLRFWEEMAEEFLIALTKFQTEEALKTAKDQLESRVRERTEELQASNRALIESQERFQQMAQNVGEIFWLASSDLRKVYYASPAYEKIMGRSLRELQDRPRAWLDTIHPEDRAHVLRAFLMMAHSDSPIATEYRVLRPDGGVVWLSNQGFPVRDEAGRIYRIAGVARDITSRKKDESELRRTHNALWILKGCDEALARAASETELLERVCQIILGIEGMKMAWVGYLEENEAKSVRPIAQAGDTGGYLQDLEFSWALKEEHSRDPVGLAIRTHRVAISRDLKEGAFKSAKCEHGFASEACLPLIWEGRCMGVLAIYSSLSDAFNEQEVDLLTRLAADLTHGIQTLRARLERIQLQEELLKISDWEKQSIAQEIHDGLCQHLVGTAMMGNLLHRKLAARQDPHAEDAKQISELLTMGATEARNLAHGLHPVKPEPEGLMAALSGLAQMVAKLFQVACRFDCTQPVLVEDQSTASHLFRMAQEAVNNAMKHGQASEVVISLEDTGREIILKIQDNGVGIPARQTSSPGMGFKIMRYRAQVIGASIEIGSARESGTIVRCVLPHTLRP